MSCTPFDKLVSWAEAAYRWFYDLRTEASRTLKALGQMEKPDIPSDVPSVQEVKKKLEALRQQKSDSSHTKQKQLQAEIEEASSEILSPSQEQEFLQRESQRGLAEKLRQELADLIAEQKTVETSLAAAQGLRGKCPTCGQPISEEVKTTEMETMRERLADLEGLIQGTKEELSEYAELGMAIPRLEGHRKALTRRAKLVEEQSKLHVVQRPNGGDLESRMTILMERINKGERVLEKAQQAESAKERWDAYLRKRSELEARISLLDKLTEFFGPTGAMTGQASDRMGSFTADLNRHLAVFAYTCNFAVEPFEIRVSSSKDSRFGLSLKYLSESEQFRFGVAFQIALAMVTGLGFVVIDGADVLDKERRKMLTALLVNSGLDQAIVLATGEDTPPRDVPAGVKFLELPSRDRLVEVRAVTAT